MSRLYFLAHFDGAAAPHRRWSIWGGCCGYDYVSLRLFPMGIPGEHAYLPQDTEMVQQTKQKLLRGNHAAAGY